MKYKINQVRERVKKYYSLTIFGKEVTYCYTFDHYPRPSVVDDYLNMIKKVENKVVDSNPFEVAR